MSPLPYAGLRVLDLSQGIAGPYCATLLALQGADVVKVEPPAGDWGRRMGGGREGMTPIAIAGNLGKRGIALDATRSEGRDLLLDLAARADVVVQNSRPGVMERLGLGYADVAARNAQAIYLSISGFGPDGPEAGRPGTDSVLQSFTGIAWKNRDAQGTPRRVPVLVPDMATGIYAAQAVGAALWERSRTGKGRHVQISLMEACAALQAINVLEDAIFEHAPPPPTTVPSGVFRTADGWLTLVTISDEMFFAMLRVLGLDAWISDPRFAKLAERQANAALVNDEIARLLPARPTGDWLAAFAQADVLCAKIADYREFRASPQAAHAKLFREVVQPPYGKLPLTGTPGLGAAEPLGRAPALGEHTFAVLREAGVPESTISALAAAGVILQRP
jgi:crotonobetainyl-CoA:carnitine CoA-transferase CaiB-like acyl-CoA transferase